MVDASSAKVASDVVVVARLFLYGGSRSIESSVSPWRARSRQSAGSAAMTQSLRMDCSRIGSLAESVGTGF